MSRPSAFKTLLVDACVLLVFVVRSTTVASSDVSYPKMMSFLGDHDKFDPRRSSNSLGFCYDSRSRRSYFDQCYTDQKELGRGFTGKVVKATSVEDGYDYAMKIVDFKSDHESGIDFSQREAYTYELLANQNPNINRMYKVWRQGNSLYMETALCREDLLSYINRQPHKRLPKNKIRDVLKAVLSAYSYLHSFGIVHMDLWAKNVLLCDSSSYGTVYRIIDFGMVLLHQDSREVEKKLCKIVGPFKDWQPMIEEVQYNCRLTPATDIARLGLMTLTVALGKREFDDLYLEGGGPDSPGGTLIGEIQRDLLAGRHDNVFPRSLAKMIAYMIHPNTEKRRTAKWLLNNLPERFD